MYMYIAWFSSDFDPIPCSRAIESWIIVAVETVGNGCLRGIYRRMIRRDR